MAEGALISIMDADAMLASRNNDMPRADDGWACRPVIVKDRRALSGHIVLGYGASRREPPRPQPQVRANATPIRRGRDAVGSRTRPTGQLAGSQLTGLSCQRRLDGRSSTRIGLAIRPRWPDFGRTAALSAVNCCALLRTAAPRSNRSQAQWLVRDARVDLCGSDGQAVWPVRPPPGYGDVPDPADRKGHHQVLAVFLCNVICGTAGPRRVADDLIKGVTGLN
jgi:hypothetical protein